MEDDEGLWRVCWRASIGLRQWERRQLAQGLYNMYDLEQTDYPKDVNIFMICTMSPFPSYSYIKNFD